jgi:hypothetical protein
MVDLELMTAGGDARDLMVRFGSVLAAMSFIFAYVIVPRYLTSGLAHARLARLAWMDEEFLISATIAVSGLCAVMSWNTVYPDKRDSLILGLIPVRLRTMIGARIAAIATVLGAAIAALNSFTGLLFPVALDSGPLDGVRAYLTWWLVICAAGVFTFCAGLALQGLVSQLLPWRLFLRVSGVLQLLALFTVLALLFLTPPFDTLHPPAFIPSFWFVGLLHELRRDPSPLFDNLALRALFGMGVAIPVATVLYVVCWTRNVRRIVESPEILPAKRTRFAVWLARRWSPAPFERAILLFTARTMARSRQHRLMLAIYGGFAFAMSLAFCGSFLDGTSRESWNRPNGPFLIAGILLLSCTVVGTRAIFALPIALPANWIFRITAVHRPADYFAPVRKSLYTFGALPLWAAAAICYLAIWPGRPAFQHVLILALIGVTLVERSLYQFRKIPFTCSWLPGSTQGKLKASMWGFGFLILAGSLSMFELWTVDKLARMVTIVAILSAVAIRSRMRTAEFAADPGNRLQFEDTPHAEIFALDLRQDGNWSGDEAYVEAIDPNMGRSLARRMMPFAVGAAMLLTAGFVYEQAGEWRDRREFPRVGRSVDIGGRSLNIFCSGSGSPAVVFDAGDVRPGYSWLPVQREVAAMTRACWYDRAGYGWSDAAPGARTGADMAEDLYRLLHAAGIAPPYLLVGQQAGGFDVRVFADRHRSEVIGMVLVDSADEFEEPDRIPVSLLGSYWEYLPRPTWGLAAGVSSALGHLGLARLMDGGPGAARGGLSGRDTAIIHSLQIQAKSFDTYLREGLDRDQTTAQVREIRSLGDIALVALSGAGNRQAGTQARLAALSTRGRVASAEAVTEAVREVLDWK